MDTERLRALVEELSKAEKEHLDEEGPLRTRLHEAITALCKYVGVRNAWNDEP
jgi:hypothetical protein